MKFGTVIKVGNIEKEGLKLENIELSFNSDFSAQEAVTMTKLVRDVIEDLPSIIEDFAHGAMAANHYSSVLAGEDIEPKDIESDKEENCEECGAFKLGMCPGKPEETEEAEEKIGVKSIPVDSELGKILTSILGRITKREE